MLFFGHHSRIAAPCFCTSAGPKYQVFCLTGAPVHLMFRSAMTDDQRAWLRTTTVPLLSITFIPEEPASHIILQPVSRLHG